jgi:hypothetical protein
MLHQSSQLSFHLFQHRLRCATVDIIVLYEWMCEAKLHLLYAAALPAGSQMFVTAQVILQWHKPVLGMGHIAPIRQQ